MEKVNFWKISNYDNMRHSIGPYYDSNNCLMSQFQKSTLKFAWTLFQDHVIMLSKSTVRDGGPCNLLLHHSINEMQMISFTNIWGILSSRVSRSIHFLRNILYQNSLNLLYVIWFYWILTTKNSTCNKTNLF